MVIDVIVREKNPFQGHVNKRALSHIFDNLQIEQESGTRGRV
jgi:hypothetical protein